MGRVRVLIADDHRPFADAVAIRLGAEPDIEVVAIATSAEAASALARSLEPQVLLVDVNLSDGDGIELARRLRAERPGVQVVIVTFQDDEATEAHAKGAGVAGFLPKDAPAQALLQAVRQAARHEADPPSTAARPD